MGNVEIPNWLEGLPLAPEFRPTDTEFADPIAYISKIEKEASAFGICKIIPPLPKPSKKYVFSNLNKSLSKCPELGSVENLSNDCPSSSKTGSLDGSNDGEVRAVFTTRHQELGQSVRKTKGGVQNPPLGVQKQVWQSGEIYTLEQFESKSKAFAKSQLGMIKEVSPLVVEAIFWKAACEKPIYLEYANDVPGSGFGEPEGQFRYFHRRRRKRNFYRRSRDNSSCKRDEMVSDRIAVSKTNDVKDSAPKNDSDSFVDVSKPPTSLPVLPCNETPQSSKKKSQNSCHDKEGTAGWKLSNSPWNLQVISRSPGSLTRFMPDDIPGVTSPMVYIGMLFSWFAWHVEDHELHSMNFLHSGSSKTWYSVPGDYAFTFEEVVRSEAYGGNIDRLAALALLGEKTTLMSPEVVVASGIPCCRLVQNPGEFVVTFPRAYHVGFSHGFNCGEAANFGTPQWLKVAKEAAVRRAAMNYLPMLSHQQLLYLLTMSFVSRVPRSLLPGVRSSRLRDRQKEERELLVKQAFIEDILHENKTLSVLLGKDSSYHAILWNPDLLTYPSKESLSPIAGATDSTPATENPQKHNGEQHYLVNEMSLYMENMNDLYFDCDDLSCDFQVDSGTLACVACGILGFPFMSVVQPSQKASEELLHNEHALVQECQGISGYLNSCSFQDLDASNKCYVAENPPTVSNSSLMVDLPLPSTIMSKNGWNANNKSLRPRSFCLEHAVEIVELLQSKGGANVIVICHSDYQKIKAHATTIAEEIGSPFNYSEVPLDIASKDDLNLIDLAIDNEEHDECGEDWTSKLGINLRHCVKIRKNSPSKQVQHALTLGGLFSDKCPSVDFLTIKWQLRRSRSKKICLPDHFKPCDTIQLKNDVAMGERSLSVKKEKKLIQYSRRNFKKKPGGSTGTPKVCVTGASLGDLDEHNRIVSENNIQNDGNSTGFDVSPSYENEIQMLEATEDENSKDGVACVETQIKNHVLEDTNTGHFAALDDSEMEDEPNVETQKVSSTDELREEQYASPFVNDTQKSFQAHEEKQIVGQFNRVNEVCSLVSERHSEVQVDKDVLDNTVSKFSKMSCSHVDPCDENFEGQRANATVDKGCKCDEVCDSLPVEAQGVHATGNKDKKEFPCNSTAIKDQEQCCEGPRQSCSAGDSSNHISLEVKPPQEIRTVINEHSLVSIEEIYEVPKETCSTEGLGNYACLEVKPEQEIKTTITEVVSASIEKISEIPSDVSAALKLCYSLTSDEELQQKLESAAGSSEELASSSVTQTEAHHPCVSAEEYSNVPRGISREEDSGNDVTSDNGSRRETLMENPDQGLVSNLAIQARNQPIPVNVEEFEVTNHAKDHLGDNLTFNNNREREIQSMNDEEKTDLPTAIPFQKYYRVKRDSRSTEDLCIGSEVCSPQDDRELEIIDSNMGKARKRKRELEQLTESKFSCNGFIRSPCEGLRPRTGKDAATSSSGIDIDGEVKEKPATKVKKSTNARGPTKDKKENSRKSHKCDIDGCRMSFDTKAELNVHKRNRCPHEGCGKRFSSHKYAMIHHRVHDDQRPLKCPWKGCSMSFKWAWARTEHIRVHTGERPYQCKIEGCGLSFRFVSDFSRHRRKTGHYVN
ncbi:probable lysine-specific demethylase ELF6 [Morus notabilis]|uniref:probable lysine-specific demethylase ELF6 n=1 Tax=Morus notabilis TaxID=981085 RepID=UPI000CED05ED|nr:probable lysine-specific demethylase ELF6 [Morus notabilis]